MSDKYDLVLNKFPTKELKEELRAEAEEQSQGQYDHLDESGEPDRWKMISPSTGEVVWQAHAGMQNHLFACSNHLGADEILLGGLRGPGKTAALIAWMAEPVHIAEYVGIFLRFSQTDLEETIDKATKIYRQMGGRQRGRPVYWEFDSGAKIYTGHLKDAKSYESYRGHEYHRIGIEEATQIESKDSYALLFGSNRSTVPGLHPKICLTSNPDGPGNGWIKKHFINVYGKNGKIQPNQPFKDELTGRIRVFIPGKKDENKTLLKIDPDYYKRLMILKPHLQKAWIEGDWDAPASQFFPEFRPNGPVLDETGTLEPEEANHVIPAQPIPPWCHRWMAMDWGYNHHSSIQWYARAQDRRMHVYREFVVRGMGADQIGTEIAKRSAVELEAMPDQHMNLFLSHEAFSSTDSHNTIAEQIEYGIKAILGPESAFVLTTNKDEKELQKLDKEAAFNQMMSRYRDIKGKLYITIRRCNADQMNGWSYMRSLLRWKELRTIIKPDMSYAQELAEQADGYLKVQAYMQMYEDQAPEVNPGLLIHGPNPGWGHADGKGCPILIETIPKACADLRKNQEKVAKWEGDDETVGDDPLDNVRFGCMAYRDIEAKVPFHEWMQREVEKHISPDEPDINLKIQAHMRARQKYDSQNKEFEIYGSLPREAMALRN